MAMLTKAPAADGAGLIRPEITGDSPRRIAEDDRSQVMLLAFF